MYKNKATMGLALKLASLFFFFLIFLGCQKDENDDTIDDFKLENRKELGTSATDLLSSDTYPNLVIEYVYAEGFRPEQQTLDGFSLFLNQHVNKNGSITFVENEIPAPTTAPFSVAEIREIEDDVRTIYTTEDTIAVYIFFANGKSTNDTTTSVTLGTAYQNTSLVLYENTLRQVSSSQNLDLGLLEATTLHHEFGHLFGLVNIQEDDIHANHEDLAHPRHCIVEECLMFFETRRSAPRSIANYFQQRRNENLVPSFDIELCIEDLRVKGGV